VIPPTGTATAAVTKPVWAYTTTVPPTGTATAPVTTTIVIIPGTIAELKDKIEGIIDTPKEVKLMADTLMAHLLNGYPPYSSVSGSDPARQTIINGLALITSLNLAQLGFGVCTIALGTGVFMVVTGLGFGLVGVYLWRRKVALQ
jgi:hypothetical protein